MEEFVDAGTVADGAIKNEVDVWSDAKAERVGELMTDIAYGIIECGDALLLLALITFHGDIDARGFAARSHDDFIDGDESDSRVGELSGDDNDEFFLDRFNEAILMMLCTAVFHERYSYAL
jgi:hypothetical protein